MVAFHAYLSVVFSQDAAMSTVVPEQEHFVPWDRVPFLRASATVLDALNVLRAQNVGGLVVIREKEDVFVKGRALASAVLEASRSMAASLSQISADTAFALAANHWEVVLSTEMNQFLKNVASQKDGEQQPGVVVLESATMDDGDKLIKYLNIGDHRAIVIQNGGQGKVWLFFNHEHFKSVFNSNPPIWLCAKEPDPHENLDPDHGNCSYCYRKLVRVK
jgi:hypothetical protein